MDHANLIVGIGGAAGDGVASAGNTLALAVARQGQGVYAYNSYQSVIRGGHSWLRLRVSAQKPLNHGDQIDGLIALNQDTLDRHLQEVGPGGVALFPAAGAAIPMPMIERRLDRGCGVSAYGLCTNDSRLYSCAQPGRPGLALGLPDCYRT